MSVKTTNNYNLNKNHYTTSHSVQSNNLSKNVSAQSISQSHYIAAKNNTKSIASPNNFYKVSTTSTVIGSVKSTQPNQQISISIKTNNSNNTSNHTIKAADRPELVITKYDPKKHSNVQNSNKSFKDQKGIKANLSVNAENTVIEKHLKLGVFEIDYSLSENFKNEKTLVIKKGKSYSTTEGELTVGKDGVKGSINMGNLSGEIIDKNKTGVKLTTAKSKIIGITFEAGAGVEKGKAYAKLTLSKEQTSTTPEIQQEIKASVDYDKLKKTGKKIGEAMGRAAAIAGGVAYSLTVEGYVEGWKKEGIKGVVKELGKDAASIILTRGAGKILKGVKVLRKAPKLAH
ncbi:hypothetical protein [Caldicellulosiruptor morganii]|uniref:Uncharacterized protein n=1 Tax=Caldicellulosiruptor morganii TaxID=1387555 RepID=A0ABY7BMR7_9FIRM|nr:hypothetical protein [Caldicellulosiruptor morganii]WAM33703.1 hypothetical protein OTK00_002235 [Caldicellulosiruptor morganii]